MHGLERKALGDELEDLKKKKEVLTARCISLQKHANQLAKQAENKSSTLMAQMMAKLNTLRKRTRDKCNEVNNTVSEMEWKQKLMS